MTAAPVDRDARLTAAAEALSGYTAGQVARALAAVKSGDVRPVEEEGRLFEVTSSDRSRTYRTTPDTCPCDARGACWHRAAAALALAAPAPMEEPMTTVRPASNGERNGGKTDLAKLATRIQDDLIERNQGEAYAAHHVITQLLLLAVGPFSFERVEVIRGDVLARNRDRDKPSFSDEHSTVILRNVVVGATCRLTCTVDGRREVIEQTGDVEHPENWQHDAARLKDAESDALKRCAMRFGLGLHLWAQEHYRLDAWLAAREQQATDRAPVPTPARTTS